MPNTIHATAIASFTFFQENTAWAIPVKTTPGA